jgi:clan AA aspartic protease (TIGR02281 family)
VFTIGLVLGWYLHAWRVAPIIVSVRSPVLTETPLTDTRLSVAPSKSLSPFHELRSQISMYIDDDRYERAFELLLEASFVAITPLEQDEFRRLLAQFVDAYTRALIEINQFQEVDAFYEQLTLSLPQFAEYQLQLGKLRIQMGNGDAALAPLAQISNHERYGAEARELMTQVERNVAADIALETLPLTGRDGQFIVEAMIDNRYPVKLLVDTGAAMTAIDAGVLQMSGYSLDVERQYFVTANGVVSAPVVTLGLVSLGSAQIAELPVGALPLSMPGDVVGLLGMNFLRHYDFRIDQNNNTLILDKR